MRCVWIDTGLSAVQLNGETLLLDTCGAAFWPARATLIFADLHLEKGSSYARGRQFLPPYDTVPPARMARRCAASAAGGSSRWAIPSMIRRRAGPAVARSPRSADGPGRAANSSGSRAITIPEPPAWLGGEVAGEWRQGGLTFRHEPQRGLRSRARSRDICIPAPVSPNGAAASAGAALSPMAGG